jgi:CDP-diacylglycerol---glycerol-3-phosphate 3-phosphatidyltransferase
MANAVSLSRLALLLPVVWLMYQPPGLWQFASFFLVILIFVSDAVDGYVARKRRTATRFGALFDIAADRIVELTLFVVAADVDLVPIWVPLVFIIRGVAVDTIRTSESKSRGVAPFETMQTAAGKFLVAGPFMRTFYAVIKACAFCSLVLLQPFPVELPALWDRIGGFLTGLTHFLVYLAVALCILRGLPVLTEFAGRRREAA